MSIETATITQYLPAAFLNGLGYLTGNAINAICVYVETTTAMGVSTAKWRGTGPNSEEILYQQRFNGSTVVSQFSFNFETVNGYAETSATPAMGFVEYSNGHVFVWSQSMNNMTGVVSTWAEASSGGNKYVTLVPKNKMPKDEKGLIEFARQVQHSNPALPTLNTLLATAVLAVNTKNAPRTRTAVTIEASKAAISALRKNLQENILPVQGIPTKTSSIVGGKTPKIGFRSYWPNIRLILGWKPRGSAYWLEWQMWEYPDETDTDAFWLSGNVTAPWLINEEDLGGNNGKKWMFFRFRWHELALGSETVGPWSAWKKFANARFTASDEE